MRQERLFAWGNPWFRHSILGLIAVTVVSLAIGFVWLPSAQNESAVRSLWQSICSAAGVPQSWLPGASVKPAVRATDVVLDPTAFDTKDPISIGRGASLSLRCTMCHGPQGISMANSPNLAGQYPLVVYKQLHDYQSGKRQNAIMSAIVVGLSEQDMRDLSAYYGSLEKPGPVFPHPLADTPSTAPAIVTTGAPMRNIAPCASCHGGMGHSTAAAWIQGMPEVYLRDQLIAFRSGARRNDASQQMRNIARNMSDEEIAQAAKYYSLRP